jgi:hypothetical protein
MTVTEAEKSRAGAQLTRAYATAHGHHDPEWAADQNRWADVLEADAEDAIVPDEPLRAGMGGAIVDPNEIDAVRLCGSAL